MQIHFILVQPGLPENVGACARALNTMGFESLRLVRPCDHLGDKARWLAHGSEDVLQRAQVCDSLREAVSGMDLVVGATAKRRLDKYELVSARNLPRMIDKKKKALQNLAVVFGRESSGLDNRELKYCDILTAIPMKKPYPSLNLSHAVMVYAYLLSPLVLGKGEFVPVNTAQTGLGALKRRVAALAASLGHPPGSRLHVKILERLAALRYRDINLLHFLCQELEKKI